MERWHGSSSLISAVALAFGCGAESPDGGGRSDGGGASGLLGGASSSSDGASGAIGFGGRAGASGAGQPAAIGGVGGGTNVTGGSTPSSGFGGGGLGGTSPGAGGAATPPTGGSADGTGGIETASGGGDSGSGGSGAATGGAGSASGGSKPETGGSEPGSGGADNGTGGNSADTGGSEAAAGGSSANTGGSGTAPGGTGGIETGAGGATGGGSHVSVPYILGADISFVQEQEDQGTRFRDGGAERDILQILKDHGFNYIRLRIFTDPGAPSGYQHEFTERVEPYCDTSHTIEMAQRVKNADMGLSLDFHYSDTWADPDDQNKPAAWVSLGFADLVTAVHDYTRDTLLELQAAGALPDMVQVGNEITPGMLLPDGSSSDWGNLSELLQAGVAAVNEVDPSIIKVMHIESPHHPDTVSWWARSAVERGVKFDILGISCYSAWHGEPSVWQSTFERVAAENPGLGFMIAEYADNYREANDIMFNLPQGVGTMFWEPTADGEWGTGLIDWQGNTRDTIDLYDQMAVDYGLR